MAECPINSASKPAACPGKQTRSAGQDSVMLRLRTETRPQHDHIESVPLSIAMQDGTLPRSKFASQMQCWLAVHDALEQALEHSEDEVVVAVWRSEMARADHIRADLLHHGDTVVSDAARRATDSAVTWINGLAEREPRALLGCLYVLEGSKLGGTILRRCLSEAYGCPPEHLTYFWSSSEKSPKPDWERFKGRMEPAMCCGEDQDRAIAAAGDMFDHMTEILLAIGVD